MKMIKTLKIATSALAALVLASCTHYNVRHYTDHGYRIASISYPSGYDMTSNVKLYKRIPKEVRLNEEFTYMIDVKNISDFDLLNVQVSEKVPAGFRLISSEPAASYGAGEKMTWNLGELKEDKIQRITVRGSLQRKEDLPCCSEVTFEVPPLCIVSDVVEPGVKVDLSIPGNGVVCNTLPGVFTITNTGDTTLHNVILKSELPKNVTTTRRLFVSNEGTYDHKRNVTSTLNQNFFTGRSDTETTITDRTYTLVPGEVVTVPFTAAFAEADSYQLKGSVTSDEGVGATTNTAFVTIKKPQASISVLADKKDIFIGRTASYSVIVRNTGDIAINNASVSAVLSDNATFASGTQGNVRGFGNQTSWTLGTLGAGESKTFDVVANTRGAGNAALAATVMGTCLDQVNARDNVKITGIPALLLEVVDLVDPIEVGGQETYVITVTNQGTAPATNVKIAASLEDMSLINSSGSSKVSESYGKLTFGVIPSIQPKAQVSWNVIVKANTAGDKRFSVSMNSDETNRSVDETESTYVY